MTALPIGRPRFVTIEQALGWHEVLIVQYGGSHGLRDLALLESALAQPRQSFGGEFAHDYPFEMAAAYALHIAKNHPFVDGNKRAALMASGAFLHMNGWSLVSEQTQAADAILDLIAGKMDKQSFAKWLQDHSQSRPSMELRDFFAALRHKEIHEQLEAGLVDADFEQAHQGRFETMMEAMRAMPAAHDAVVGAQDAEAGGDEQSALILRTQAAMLTALYRIAEDMGYEW